MMQLRLREAKWLAQGHSLTNSQYLWACTVSGHCDRCREQKGELTGTMLSQYSGEDKWIDRQLYYIEMSAMIGSAEGTLKG